MIIRLWFYPWVWIFENLLPWNMFSHIHLFISDIILNKPITIGKFGLKWSVRVAVLILSIILGLISGIIQYSIFYKISIPIVAQS